jgi:aryl-alcohol dehydrogenase-like predicted oxidoreductase
MPSNNPTPSTKYSSLAGIPRRAIGSSSLSIPPVALGTSVFGWTMDRPTSTAVLDRYIDLGGEFIDTADNYAGGMSETMIGNWMRARRSRDLVTIATKVGRGSEYPGLGRASMHAAVHASLGRLGTEYIDVLYFHIEDRTVPLEDSLAAAHELIQAGKVGVLGASNFSGGRLFEARVLSVMGLPRFETIQEHYNLMHREEYEGDVALAARSQGLGVLPHYALAHGFLGGEYRRRADGIGNARRARAGQYLNRRGLRVLSVLDRISALRGVSNAQIALAWLLARPGVVAPVVSADSLGHVDELVRAASLQLTATEIAELDRVSSPDRRGNREFGRQAD